MRHPDSFFGRSHETARISPANPYIMKPHLLCAAYEAPLTMNDTEFFGPELLWYADELIEDDYIHVRHGRWHLVPEMTYPAERVNMRTASGAFYTLVDADTGAILETVSESSAFMQLHPGAIYLHQGESYLVTELDMESHTAYASSTDAPYYTQSRDHTETRILNTYTQRQAARVEVFFGEVLVSTQVLGFKRIKHHTDEVLGDEYVELPKQEFETTALWFGPPRDTLDFIRSEKLDLSGGLHAVEHAAIGILPLFAMCDRNDIGGITTPLHPDTGQPQVFIHDGHPGGVGVSEHGYEVIEDLWRARDARSHRPVSVRVGLSVVHTLPQVRQQQPASGQAHGPSHPGVHTRRRVGCCNGLVVGASLVGAVGTTTNVGNHEGLPLHAADYGKSPLPQGEGWGEGEIPTSPA